MAQNLTAGNSVDIELLPLNATMAKSSFMQKLDIVLYNSGITITRGWALDRVHNSRWCRPCGAVSFSVVTTPRDGTARLSCHDFLTLWPWPLTFHLINWWARYRFGDFSFSHFGLIVQIDRQNHRGRSTLYSHDYHRTE